MEKIKNLIRRLSYSISRLTPFRSKDDYWEYYNRQIFVSEGIKKFGLERARVLDVGGATGNNLLKRFGIKNVTTLDIEKKADIVASAADMPLDDASYDVVTCIDTMEHIPANDRDKVVRELVRVAARMTFLVAPILSPENNEAESLVLKYRDCSFVKDHQVHGLVDAHRIRSLLGELVEQGTVDRFEEVALDDLHSWVLLMTRGFASELTLYKEAYFLENKFFPKRFGFVIYKPIKAPNMA